jgi:hydroxylamine reductase
VFGGGHKGDAFQETVPESDLAKLTEQAKAVGILSRGDPAKNDVLGLEELVTYGLKGLCAYAAHAAALGRVL